MDSSVLDASRFGNFSFGFNEDDRRRSRFAELIVCVELRRVYSVDPIYAYDLYGSTCVSFETATNTNTFCMLSCRYRMVSGAEKHMVMA